MANFLTKIFGTKADRDMKEVQPLLKKALEAYETIKTLSTDDLRHKTVEFRDRIHQATAAEENRLAEIRQYLDENYDIPIEEKQNLYKEIEKLEDKAYKTTQDVLNDILPEAFSVMKEAARRFKENETIEVTATDFDRDLAATHDGIEINGDKAIYRNTWSAGGNMITWDMCHYDVQLIGGIVLHEGKIAEMATGEGNPRGHPPSVPQRTARQGCSRSHRERLPGQA